MYLRFTYTFVPHFKISVFDSIYFASINVAHWFADKVIATQR